ncbi:MAG TPA: DUF4271 domain-containing protein [Sphingobacteriaceae bacterium]|nr:DUF4271 domain-containing protein [Sphingobacteriaceae bacterium]
MTIMTNVLSDPEVLTLATEAGKTVRPLWIIITIGVLMLCLAITHATFPSTVSQIIRSYYDQALFNQIGRGENLFSTWPAFILFILLGLSTGLFFYLAAPDIQSKFSEYPGYLIYLSLSAAVLLLFSLKILVTRFISYVFGIRRYFRTYIRVLFLSFFNSSYLFFIFALAISLLPAENTGWLARTGLILAGAILLLRLGKVAADLLSTYRFPIFYLIVYLCTLEIAPILILIKIVYL